MPSSYVQNITPIMSFLEDYRPRSVVEIGTGYGKYAFLLRERVDDFRWGMEILGVEIWGDYIERSRAARFYDEIYFGDWLTDDPVLAEALEHYGKFDIALMIDVLEHFEKDEGYWAMDKALNNSRALLISTPLGYEQGPVNGNGYETHRSEWPAVDLAEYATAKGKRIDFLTGGTPDSVIAVIR